MTVRGSFVAVRFFLLFSAAAAPVMAEGARAVDLVFYGDTRGGVLQTFLNKRHTPSEIHRALAGRVGTLEDLSDQRGIIFLGDAVSHGGCAALWDDQFFPALRNLKAFQADGDYFFYPVIGDHETYLIPESYEEARHVPIQCDLFKKIYKGPALSPARRQARLSRQLHRYLTVDRDTTRATATREIAAQTECPDAEEAYCANPAIAQTPIRQAHCLSCQYQREVCRGNCVTYTFQVEYGRDNGFGPFQDSWSASPEGATWYKIDYELRNEAGDSRPLRVLMLDTQAAAGLRAGDGKTQGEWMAARVEELDPRAFVVVAGHKPAPLRADLYEPIFLAAFERGARVLAVLAAHYHGFGSGVYTVSPDRQEGGPAHDVYFALSGDGGGRDFDEKEVPGEDRMVGPRIGSGVRVAASAGSRWTADTARDATSFGRVHVTFDGCQVTDYRVPLKSVTTSERGPSGVQKRAVRAGEPAPLRTVAIGP